MPFSSLPVAPGIPRLAVPSLRSSASCGVLPVSLCSHGRLISTHHVGLGDLVLTNDIYDDPMSSKGPF